MAMKRVYFNFFIYVPDFLIKWQTNRLLQKKFLTVCPQCKRAVRNDNFCELCGHDLKM